MKDVIHRGFGLGGIEKDVVRRSILAPGIWLPTGDSLGRLVSWEFFLGELLLEPCGEAWAGTPRLAEGFLGCLFFERLVPTTD